MIMLDGVSDNVRMALVIMLDGVSDNVTLCLCHLSFPNLLSFPDTAVKYYTILGEGGREGGREGTHTDVHAHTYCHTRWCCHTDVVFSCFQPSLLPVNPTNCARASSPSLL